MCAASRITNTVECEREMKAIDGCRIRPAAVFERGIAKLKINSVSIDRFSADVMITSLRSTATIICWKCLLAVRSAARIDGWNTPESNYIASQLPLVEEARQDVAVCSVYNNLVVCWTSDPTKQTHLVNLCISNLHLKIHDNTWIKRFVSWLVPILLYYIQDTCSVSFLNLELLRSSTCFPPLPRDNQALYSTRLHTYNPTGCLQPIHRRFESIIQQFFIYLGLSEAGEHGRNLN